MSKKEKFKAIRSPLIYAGSKGRYAKEIISNLPKDGSITKALDVFCGSGEVGIGMLPYDKVVCNDLTSQIIDIHKFLQDSVNRMPHLVDYFKSVESNYGLGKFDKPLLSTYKKAFDKLREDYNANPNPVLLYLLHCNSFSNGIRFNQKKFNYPYGRRNFNPSLQKKLTQWLNILGEKDVTFTSEDFRKLDFNTYDFLYLDPVYLLTSAGYSESSKTGWGIKEEYSLYKKIDQYDGRFMLSNQLYSKGQCNYILEEWIKSREDLVVLELDNGSYKNCNYQRKDGETTEILVMNYQP